MHIDELLKRMVEKKSSDLILRVGTSPVLRIDGSLVPQPDMVALTGDDLQKIFETIASPDQRATFSREYELDLALNESLPSSSKFTSLISGMLTGVMLCSTIASW